MVNFQISDLPCQRALQLQESPVLVQNHVLARMTECCLREGWWAGALPPAARRARERGVRAAPDIRRARRRLQRARLRPPPPGLLLLLLYSRTGPRRALSLKLSDTRVYEPEKRTRSSTSHPK